MEKVEKWEDLEASRKFELLDHWFYYYGGVPVTLEEWKEFRKLANIYADQIFDFIITSFVAKDTIKTNVLVGAMRAGKVKELFDVIVKYAELSEEEKKAYDPVRCSILEEIENTYLHPEPPVPMDLGIVFGTEGGPEDGGLEDGGPKHGGK